MPIDTKEHDPLAIEAQHACFDLEAPHTHRLLDDLNEAAFGRVGSNDGPVEVRILWAPQVRLVDVNAIGAFPIDRQLAETLYLDGNDAFAHHLQSHCDLSAVVVHVGGDADV